MISYQEDKDYEGHYGISLLHNRTKLGKSTWMSVSYPVSPDTTLLPSKTNIVKAALTSVCYPGK